MLDFTAYLMAQEQTGNLALQARPDAPVRPDRIKSRRALPDFQMRRRFSTALRYLADLVEPAPAPREPELVRSR